MIYQLDPDKFEQLHFFRVFRLNLFFYLNCSVFSKEENSLKNPNQPILFRGFSHKTTITTKELSLCQQPQQLVTTDMQTNSNFNSIKMNKTEFNQFFKKQNV